MWTCSRSSTIRQHQQTPTHMSWSTSKNVCVCSCSRCARSVLVLVESCVIVDGVCASDHRKIHNSTAVCWCVDIKIHLAGAGRRRIAFLVSFSFFEGEKSKEIHLEENATRPIPTSSCDACSHWEQPTISENIWMCSWGVRWASSWCVMFLCHLHSRKCLNFQSLDFKLFVMQIAILKQLKSSSTEGIFDRVLIFKSLSGSPKHANRFNGILIVASKVYAKRAGEIVA